MTDSHLFSPLLSGKPVAVPGAAGERLLRVSSPVDGTLLATLPVHEAAEVETAITASTEAFRSWREVPAPRRGELIRRFAGHLRTHKAALAEVIIAECGKIRSEALGEVQEIIDICDYAVGLSRQLAGQTLPSERPGHRLQESWLPLGPVGVISAFNFPMAVWSWNVSLALVCGNPVLWKPSEKAPLCALACQHLLQAAIREMPDAPDQGLHCVLVGGPEIGRSLADDRRIPLLSATGSCRMGRDVSIRVASRLGRSLLELGGNNAAIVTPSADWSITLPALVFGAAGTAGQRCTTTRRVFIHESRYAEAINHLAAAFARLRVGDPSDPDTLVGPLIDENAYQAQQQALREARQSGLAVYGGERITLENREKAYYVSPALVDTRGQLDNQAQEVFAPILYAFIYRTLNEAIERQNAVPQGLSSAIFSENQREIEQFLSASGSDCGLANVNTGTSGAEIGGAFGGEKDTGGGRESGSDAWKQYMRRCTATINYSGELPLAQGVDFQIDETN